MPLRRAPGPPSGRVSPPDGSNGLARGGPSWTCTRPRLGCGRVPQRRTGKGHAWGRSAPTLRRIERVDRLSRSRQRGAGDRVKMSRLPSGPAFISHFQTAFSCAFLCSLRIWVMLCRKSRRNARKRDASCRTWGGEMMAGVSESACREETSNVAAGPTGLQTGEHSPEFGPWLAQASILVVDDEPGMRNFLVRTLGPRAKRIEEGGRHTGSFRETGRASLRCRHPRQYPSRQDRRGVACRAAQDRLFRGCDPNDGICRSGHGHRGLACGGC